MKYEQNPVKFQIYKHLQIFETMIKEEKNIGDDQLLNSYVNHMKYKMLHDKIEKLWKGSDADKEYAKLLRLELAYVRKAEMNTLVKLIQKKLKIKHVDDYFTLQDIGDVLGVTRERVRQIEETVKKRFMNPHTSRKIKTYMKD